MRILNTILLLSSVGCGTFDSKPKNHTDPYLKPNLELLDQVYGEFLIDCVKYESTTCFVKNERFEGLVLGLPARFENTNTMGVCETRLNTKVYVSPNAFRSTQYVRTLVYHELGHCLLGLDHSDTMHDIMYPILYGVEELYWDVAVKDMFDEAALLETEK